MSLLSLGSAFPSKNKGLVMPDSRAALGKWKFSVRGNFFDRKHVKRMMDDMTYRALYNAGYSVKQAAKKGVGNNPPFKSKKSRSNPQQKDIVEYKGGLYQDLTMTISGKPRAPGRPIKSWAPKRFMYYDIMDFFNRNGIFGRTVVIGPYKAPWLARLHEFGGATQFRAYIAGSGAARNAYLRKSAGRSGAGRDSKGRFTKGTSLGPQKNQFEYGGLLWTNRPLRSRKVWRATSLTRVGRYPARPFMQGAKGVQKAVEKANEKFRNMLRKAG